MSELRKLLVIGAGRGGTSLVAACLAGHPDVEMISEHGGRAILMEGSATSPSTLLWERLDAFRAACEFERAKSRRKIFGNKITTEQIMGLEEHNALNGADENVVARFFEHMSDYEPVFVLRDGRSCIASKMRRAGRTLSFSAYAWRYSVRVFRELVDSGRLHALLRYEDLVATPEVTLRRLCLDLGIEFHDCMLDQTGSEIILPEYRQDGFKSAASDPTEIPDAFLEYISKDLAELGYA